MFDTIYGFGFRYVLWNGHLNVACLLLSYDRTNIHCVERLALGKVPRITLKAPHWDCGTDITCIWSLSLLTSILAPYSTLNPYFFYLVLLRTYLYSRWDTRLVCQLDFESRRNISRRDILKEDHDQQKRDHLACSTYQQILKGHAKLNLINYSTIVKIKRS